MKSKDLGKYLYLLKGLFLAFIISLVLILIFSVLLTYSPIKESKTPLANTIIMMMSVTSGSIYVARMIKEKGWINGGIMGLCYYMVLITLRLVFLDNISLDIFSVSKLILAIFMGVIGGIIGINL